MYKEDQEQFESIAEGDIDPSELESDATE